MLTGLAVHDFVIVERLDLEIGPGMTVLTGETGAGKSILVDALSVALGERASAELIRAGADRAEVCALFHLTADAPARAWLAEHDLDEDGECVLRRTWSRDGRSRGFVNGRPVAAQNLRELADLLVDVHGQHAHQQLLHRDAHRRLLDEYAGNDKPLAEVAAAHASLRSLEAERDRLAGGAAGDDAARLELARYQLQELEALAPRPREFETLHAEHQRLTRGAELVEACAAAMAALDEDEANARTLIAAARRALAPFNAIAPALQNVLASLDTAEVGLNEATGELRDLAESLEPDPERLQTVESRLDAMHELARKHRRPAAELTAVEAELSERVAALENAAGRLAELEQELGTAQERYADACERLSKRRRTTATRLAEAVSHGLHELGMPGARFAVTVEQDIRRISPYGRDRVEFQVATNPGQEPTLLSRVASGGELSRIGLTLETVTTRGSGVPTLIFDEVDAGIGGAVAEVVGRQMQRLSTRCQVLCVTHLPQVASLADHHIHVSKQTGGAAASARLEAVEGDRRVREIARMLAGSRITERTLAHAREMLESR